MFGLAFGSPPFGGLHEAPDACGPLMKKSTAGEIEDAVRKDDLPTQYYLDRINWACDFLKEKYGLREKYVCYRELGVGTSFDVSDVVMAGVMKVVDSINGLCRLINPDEFERLDLTLYGNSVFSTLEGDTLRVSYGSNLTQGGVTLYFYRNVIEAKNRDERPDLPDSFRNVLIETLKGN